MRLLPRVHAFMNRESASLDELLAAALEIASVRLGAGVNVEVSGHVGLASEALKNKSL